ncbi:hypothetical protein A3A05_02235 [Candidatus Nomurabacteria bacterium RIFCSPLOWO2_01_FULL_41_12]|uniref:PNPLA domain-containing protein n=1 Tax=Candidatus Nomurabacteria bacterium RIFCSPLOWO2_01_FULL_41_12 TaxID=1801774 RepID=A0A1F6WUH7_9BACT|nr:MAG: hypothetical protein A2732_02155 [Candidatus Nomurabacteria bacterium RIFCSPHIGHO2_01_FULL_40_10]OGI85531.1 MAG: hypothetical protein A3A05_02235 [Candidatus Nomurabacteria bacterium RIFCSPLOWO2_01_FULL_41_12]
MERPPNINTPRSQDNSKPIDFSPYELNYNEFWGLVSVVNSKDPKITAKDKADTKAQLAAHNAALAKKRGTKGKEAYSSEELSHLSETGASKEEFDFYQNHFKGMADRHNKRKGWERIVDKNILENDKPKRPKKISKEYVMQERAEMENRDFDRMLDQERREWDPDLQRVVEALKSKRDDPEGKGKKRVVVMYQLGGGLKGPAGGAVVAALHEMGITPAIFKALVGSSCGLDNEIYYADGKESTYRGISIYYEECNTKKFLDVRPGRLDQIMDVSVVEDAMREGPKALNQERIKNQPCEIHAVVTPVNSGKAKLVDVKTAVNESGKPDMIAAVKGSMNVRLFRAPGTMVNGELVEDGSFGKMELQTIIDKFKPDDPDVEFSILVIPNTPFKKLEEFKASDSLLEHLPDTDLINSGSVGTFRKFQRVSAGMRDMVREFKEAKGVNIGVLWPPDTGLDTLDQDPDQMKIAVVDTIRDTVRQFGELPLEKIKIYESEESQDQKAA